MDTLETLVQGAAYKRKAFFLYSILDFEVSKSVGLKLMKLS